MVKEDADILFCFLLISFGIHTLKTEYLYTYLCVVVFASRLSLQQNDNILHHHHTSKREKKQQFVLKQGNTMPLPCPNEMFVLFFSFCLSHIVWVLLVELECRPAVASHWNGMAYRIEGQQRAVKEKHMR